MTQDHFDTSDLVDRAFSLDVMGDDEWPIYKTHPGTPMGDRPLMTRDDGEAFLGRMKELEPGLEWRFDTDRNAFIVKRELDEEAESFEAIEYRDAAGQVEHRFLMGEGWFWYVKKPE